MEQLTEVEKDRIYKQVTNHIESIVNSLFQLELDNIEYKVSKAKELKAEIYNSKLKELINETNPFEVFLNKEGFFDTITERDLIDYSNGNIGNTKLILKYSEKYFNHLKNKMLRDKLIYFLKRKNEKPLFRSAIDHIKYYKAQIRKVWIY